MTRGTMRDRWRREVYRTPLVTDSVKVLLLALAESMEPTGYVSVPRTDLAARLGRSPRRIQERVDLAVRAGLLDRVRKGEPGVTAVYKASFPNASAEPVRSASSRPLTRLLDPPEGGADDRPTTTARSGADDRPKDMGRIAAPMSVRTTAPSGHAQHGAVVGPAKGRNTETPASRAACEPGTGERRDDSEDETRPRLRAVDGAA